MHSLAPLNILEHFFWSLWNSTRAQRTLLDHHGPPNGPQNGSCEANFGGPLLKKGPPGPLHGPNWTIFLDRPLDNSKKRIYSLVLGQSNFWFHRYKFLKPKGQICPPPWLWLKECGVCPVHHHGHWTTLYSRRCQHPLETLPWTFNTHQKPARQISDTF